MRVMTDKKIEDARKDDLLKYIKEKIRSDGSTLSEIEDLYGLGKNTLMNTLNGHIVNVKAVKFVSMYTDIYIDTIVDVIIHAYHKKILQRIKDDE